jgi:predicted phosphoribosyltransferase
MFDNRKKAGEELAGLLNKYKNHPNAIVLALPRGGVVLGSEVAKRLNLPLDVVMVRKIGQKNYPEYAIGAVAENEPAIYNEREVLLADNSWLKKAEEQARELIKERIKLYFGEERKRERVKNKIAILVDDGIATGFTMESALIAVKNKGAKKIVAAIPVAPLDTIARLKQLADEVIVADNPKNFLGAVGSHYYEFEQVSDDEVVRLLKEPKTR